MGWCVDVSLARQVESSVSEFVSVSQQGLRVGTTGSGLVRGTHPVAVDPPSQVSAPQCKVSAEEKRASRAIRQEKGNLLEGKERMTGP